MTLKIAVFAPMPRASVRTAVSANQPLFESVRIAVKSCFSSAHIWSTPRLRAVVTQPRYDLPELVPWVPARAAAGNFQLPTPKGE